MVCSVGNREAMCEQPRGNVWATARVAPTHPPTVGAALAAARLIYEEFVQLPPARVVLNIFPDFF